MSVPYRGRKAYKEPQCEELHREISEVSEDLDMCCKALKELVPKFQGYATTTRKLDKEISRMSEDLDALAEGLMRLEDEVSSLKPKKRGRPKKK